METGMQTCDQSTKPNSYREVIISFLKIGMLAYGGPAIMGVMQNELQEKRQWVTKERFLEGLSLVSMLPGPGATQLGIFLGYSRCGWWGGLLAGLCFMLPAFFIMLALTVFYTYFGSTLIARGALYGLGPVVLGIFIVAVFRLGRKSITNLTQVFIYLAAGGAVVFSPLGIAMTLVISGAVGIFFFFSKRTGLSILLGLAACLTLYQLVLVNPIELQSNTDTTSFGLLELGIVFLKIGALTFGGGLTVIAFVQEQVVNHYHWLTHQEFIDGLALGQFTPGPILMIAAYVGFKTLGLAGAVIGALAIFIPSFVIILILLPLFDRVRTLGWMIAAMKGIGPATIGVLSVSLAQLAPHAVTDYFTLFILLSTVLLILLWKIGSIKMMLGGAIMGILQKRVLMVLTNKI